MNRTLTVSILIAFFLLPPLTNARTELPDEATLRSWVQEMKTSSRGPFCAGFVRTAPFCHPKNMRARIMAAGFSMANGRTR